MANNLKVTITATDKATASINKINASMNRMLSPLRGAQNIGNAIAKNPAVHGLRSMGSAVSTVASGLSKISGGMVGLTGIGTLAGLAEMTAHWTRMNREIQNTSLSLGMSTKGLVSMRGAARMAGLEAGTMDAGLESIRQTMQDARWGRNQPLLSLMSKLNIGFKLTKDGAIDAQATLKDVADAIAAQKEVGAKHTIAQAFGVDGLLPLLNEGSAAIEKYQKQINSMDGAPSDAQIKRNKEFAQSIELIKSSLDGGARNLTYDLQGLALKGINFVKGLGLIPAAPGQQSASGKIKPLPGAAPLGVQSPLGIRTNNPLNLQPGGKQDSFPTLEAGINAAVRNLMSKRYFGGGNDTAAGIINKWSPGNAPGNSPQKTANYISAVEREVGSGHLNPNDPATMAKLLSAMIRQENGAGSYDKTAMDQAVQHVLIEFKNAPAGTTATARTAGGATVPVRVATAMPAMGSP
jgi:hypothetical protein